MYGFLYKGVIKQLLNSAFVLSEEFIWSSWVMVLSASSDNTVFNLRNSSDHTQPHQIIANCLKPYHKFFRFT